jgi:hypothetical protein
MPVETTVKQMALTRDTGPGGFMERCTATMAFACNSILTEPGGTPYHQQRAFYAQKVVQMPQQSATMAGPQIVMGVNVISTTTYDEVEKTSVCTIADIDLQSQILTLWNSLAGIDTPS